MGVIKLGELKEPGASIGAALGSMLDEEVWDTRKPASLEFEIRRLMASLKKIRRWAGIFLVVALFEAALFFYFLL